MYTKAALCIPLIMLAWMGCSQAATAQDIFKGYEHLFTPPKHYMVYRTPEAIHIDGRPLETAWQKASWSDYFVDIEGDKQPAPAFKTRVKMLWDDTTLYIYTEMEEPHIWGLLKQHDDIIYLDNDFEVFVDPGGTTHNYFEFEINALGTMMDLFLPRPYRNQTRPLLLWSAPDVQANVYIDGTLNNATDTDRMWSVEMAIPFTAVSMDIQAQPPVDGTQWRINFSRVEYDVDITGTTYQKRKDANTNRPLPEHNWVWSPQGIISMHCPERWGYALFSNTPVSPRNKDTFKPGASDELKKYLWLLYYKQAAYQQQHTQYAQDMAALDYPNTIKTPQGQRCELTIEATTRQYIASIQNMDTGEKWQITHQGYITPVTEK